MRCFSLPGAMFFTFALASLSFAGNPDLYDYDVPASFVSSIVVELDDAVGHDLTGDGVPDNALGSFLSVLIGLEPALDPNPELADAIATGSLALGCAWPTLGANVENATGVDIHFLSLADPDGNPDTRDAYLVDRTSFEEGTAEPLIQFQGGAIRDAVLAAGPSTFRLDLSLGDVPLPVVIEEARLSGTVGRDALGVTLAGGTLSGAIPLESLLAAVNAYVLSDSCSCIQGLAGPLIDLEALECRREGVDASLCTGEQATCKSFVDFCALLLLSFTNAADIDLDGDGEPDALSAFLRLEAQGTVLLGPEGPADCNENGIPDDQDIRDGTSRDLNGDGVPDECRPAGTPFHRGDADDSGSLELTDGVYILRYLFAGGRAPPCLEAADVNNRGDLDLTDGVAVLRYLFQGAAAPAPPGPVTEPCGPDPDPPGSAGDLGCEMYAHCG